MLRPRSLIFPAFIALATLAAGCGGSGDELPRQSVYGTVTYDGQPIKNGRITFMPTDTSGEDPVSGGAPIIDGKYEIGQEVGLVPGSYSVSINSAGDAAGAGGDEPGSMGMPKELLPDKYNTASKLNATVEAGKSDPIDFTLDK